MPTASSTVRAYAYDRYGGTDELHVVEVPRPEPSAGEVRVRVLASSINSADQRLLRADPFLARLDNGLWRPRRRRVLGADVCGVVEAVGAGVTRVSVGDEVFGASMRMGAFASSMILREVELAHRPRGVSIEACAAAPLAAITAIQAVRERARVAPGQRVLVVGAGGGVGSMLVQVAKAYGLHVTAMAGAKSAAMLRDRGADVVLDHRRQQAPDDAFDAVFGVNGHRPLGAYLAWLKRGGVYVMVGGDNRQIFAALLFGKLRFLGSGRRVEILTLDDAKRIDDMAELATLLAEGRLRPVIAQVTPLVELPRAMREAWGAHVAGKIVIDARGFDDDVDRRGLVGRIEARGGGSAGRPGRDQRAVQQSAARTSAA